MEAGEIVPNPAVQRFDGPGELFGLDEQVARDDLSIDLPCVGGDTERLQMRDSCPESFEGLSATSTHLDGEDAPGEGRYSNPYPQFIAFFWV